MRVRFWVKKNLMLLPYVAAAIILIGPTSGNAQTLVSVTISPLQPSVAIGNTQQMSATAHFSDSSTQDVTSSTVWTSSDPSKLSVASTGIIEGLATASTAVTQPHGLATGTVALTGTYSGQIASTDVTVSTMGNTVWSGPIVITAGGTYSGNWQSLNPNINAVTINTTAPVIIKDSHIQGMGPYLIFTPFGGEDLTIQNTVGLGLNPNVLGQTLARFVQATNPARLVVEHCYWENVLYGVRVQGYSGNSDGNQTIIIRYNRGRNAIGLDSDGRGDYSVIVSTDSQGSNNLRKFSHMIQIEGVHSVPGMDISWNELFDEPYKSNVDDVLSFYQSSGTSASHLRVHDNFLHGDYPYDPIVDHYSANGIVVDGDTTDTLTTAAGFIEIYNNQIIAMDNSSGGFGAGHDLQMHDNKVVSSGLLPDGTTHVEYDAVGLSSVDYYMNGPRGTFSNNTIRNNTVGYTCWHCGSTNRLDYVLTSDPSDLPLNISVEPAGPIAFAVENAELPAWIAKTQANRITVGPTFSIPQTPAPPEGVRVISIN